MRVYCARSLSAEQRAYRILSGDRQRDYWRSRASDGCAGTPGATIHANLASLFPTQRQTEPIRRPAMMAGSKPNGMGWWCVPKSHAFIRAKLHSTKRRAGWQLQFNGAVFCCCCPAIKLSFSFSWFVRDDRTVGTDWSIVDRVITNISCISKKIKKWRVFFFICSGTLCPHIPILIFSHKLLL